MYNLCLGSAFGDALGAPFEVLSRKSQKLVNWDGMSFADPRGHKFHTINFAETTDDYAMTKIIVNSLIKNNGFNPEDLARDYVHWLFGPNSKGYGKTTELALKNLQNGISYKDSGIVGSFGNGTAMRAAPFGLFAKSIEELIEISTIDAKITHNSNEAIAGSIAVALMVYCIKNSQEFDSNHLPDSIVKDKINSIDSMLNLTMEEGLRKLGTKFDVKETVPSVIFAFKKSPNFTGMVELIKNGGDTDTNASIFGSMLGAMNYKFPTFVEQLKEYEEVISLDKDFNHFLLNH